MKFGSPPRKGIRSGYKAWVHSSWLAEMYPVFVWSSSSTTSQPSESKHSPREVISCDGLLCAQILYAVERTFLSPVTPNFARTHRDTKLREVQKNDNAHS